LNAHRFLYDYRDLFTRDGAGKSWPRWKDTWKAANAYFEGTLRPGRRKNMQCISHRMMLDEDRIERFVRESPWEYEDVQEHLITHIPDAIKSQEAALIVDDVGLVKQGKHSVGVHRQYSGALGKIGNCQVAVDLIYASPGKERNADQRTWPLGMRLYLPKEWAEDNARRREVGVPRSVSFKTKPGIALEMLDRVLEQKVEHAVVVADAGYGDNSELRRALRGRKEPYVMGINPSSFRVMDPAVPIIPPGPSPQLGAPRQFHTYPKGTVTELPKEIAKRVKSWTKVTWSEGTKGELSGEFFLTRVRVTEHCATLRHATDEVAWLLLEKRGDGLKAYLCWGLDGASIEELVAYAHLRWTIEQFHKEAKQLLGLDRFEGRSWKGWHHHVTVVMLAHAFLSMLRAEQDPHDPLPSLRMVARAVLLESATQFLVKKHRFDRPKAKAVASDMLRGFTDW
jgi:SRSO17 transposase